MDRFLAETVRAFNERDGEALVALTDPDVEITLHGGFADLMGARFEGHDGVRRYYTDLFSTFETSGLEVEEVLPTAHGFLTLVKLTATAAGVEMPVEISAAISWTFGKGLVLRAGFYYDRSEALAVAGLA